MMVVVVVVVGGGGGLVPDLLKFGEVRVALGSDLYPVVIRTKLGLLLAGDEALLDEAPQYS